MKSFQRHRRASTMLGRLRLQLRTWYESAQKSLFFLPCLAVFFSIFLGVLLTRLDQHLSTRDYEIPTLLATTVDNAQALLSTVASATISFAGTAFSVSLLVIQLTSQTYSPRIIDTMFRDPYNKRVMALVIGTFSYCLVVLRSAKEAVEGMDETGDSSPSSNAIVPHIAVAFAGILAILSVLATVGFIDHAAHCMDISEILENITVLTIQAAREQWLEDVEEQNASKEERVKLITEANLNDEDEKDFHVACFKRSGWVQAIDLETLEDLIEQDGVLRLKTTPGRYAIPGVPICTISHIKTSSDDSIKEEFDSIVKDAVTIGLTRTMREDPAYGLRQLVDVALRALSPGVNDPTTAQDAIFHSAAVVVEFLSRRPPVAVRKTENGGALVLSEQHSLDSIVLLAYDEVRICAAASPTVCIYLLESLRLIRESLTTRGFSSKRAPEIERQALLIEKGCLANMSPDVRMNEDCEMIRKARMDRFPELERISNLTGLNGQ